MAKKQPKKDNAGPGRPSDGTPAARALVIAVEALNAIPSCNTAYKCHGLAMDAMREMRKVLP